MDYLFYGDLLISLINNLLFDKEITDFPQDLDYEEFFKFSKFHKMENIAFSALKKIGVDSENLSSFESKYTNNLYSIASQRTMLSLIGDAFEKNGIDYLVLKGQELSKLYPNDDLRTSTDIDIYVGKNAPKCKEIMESLGFKTEYFDALTENHDEYTCRSVLCELHPVLITNENDWKDECNSITDRLERANGHRMQMSLEDFYLYNLSHTAKHMKFRGIGIKVYLDFYLILREYEDKLDRKILNERLKRANLLEFEKCSRELLDVWFNGAISNPVTDAMKEFVYSSGFCGTNKQLLAYEYSKGAKKTNSVFIAKVSKCFDIFSEPYNIYASKYPVLQKHKYLTPIFRVWRIISAVLFKRDVIKNTLGKFDDVDVDYSNEVTAFKQSIGL